MAQYSIAQQEVIFRQNQWKEQQRRELSARLKRERTKLSDLRSVAASMGVGAIFDLAHREFGAALGPASPIAGTIGFTASTRSRRLLMQLLPHESNKVRGLRFKMHLQRIADLIATDSSAAKRELLDDLRDELRQISDVPRTGPVTGWFQSRRQVDSIASILQFAQEENARRVFDAEVAAAADTPTTRLSNGGFFGL
jgi:plasmid stabilization system protein ParE